ncbi:MAG TPA: 5'-nucleotidase C-terminal domain-containing protein, partial [Thermodesulfobacteriota bacterium]|nr:5'-nucleotidase C-terminal domain-containing protein [Thermodesulfobacteriota bacterium]
GKADVVIVLSHIGHAADRLLAAKVKGIDVIVGGHSHTRVEKPVRVGDTSVVQAWEHGKALGVLDIVLKDGRVANVSARLEEIRPDKGQKDPAIGALVDKYRGKVDAVLNTPAGEAGVDLDGESVRKKETNLGDFIADILRRESKADAAIINGGTIRTGIKKGEVRVKDVYSVLPFDNYIVAVRMSGKGIVEALEHGVSGIESGEGWFPQVSGIAFRYSPSGEKGRRIRDVTIAGHPLDPGKQYVVATHDFLAVGGDGYRSFAEAIKSSPDFSVVGGAMQGEKVVYSNSGRWLRDVVVDYLREKGKIAPAVEGRITEEP